MRTISAVCVLALLLSAYATTSSKVMSPMNTKPARNIVSVMTQVEAMMTNGGPIELVKDILDQFENEITAEQSAHDGLHEAAVVECAAEADFRRREVNDAVATLREATATFQSCEDQTRRANSDLRSAESALIDTRARLLILSERREAESAQFGADQSLFELNSASIEETVEFLEELLAGEGSFEELAQLGQKLMKGAMKSGQVAEFGSAFAVLAALSNKNTDSDAELFEQVRNVLNNLIEALGENWTHRVEIEDLLIAEGEAQVEAAESIVRELLDFVDELHDELRTLGRCVVTETGTVATATAKRDRNQRLWDDSVELCASGDAFYEQSKEQRREERDIIDAVRQKVQLRWG